jgi:hypothetical protein
MSPVCQYCRPLLGASRSTLPHAYLVFIRHLPSPSRTWVAPEDYTQPSDGYFVTSLEVSRGRGHLVRQFEQLG